MDLWTQSDGISALLRADDGQAYEVQVRPAAAAQHPSMREKYGTGRGWTPRWKQRSARETKASTTGSPLQSTERFSHSGGEA